MPVLQEAVAIQKIRHFARVRLFILWFTGLARRVRDAQGRRFESSLPDHPSLPYPTGFSFSPLSDYLPLNHSQNFCNSIHMRFRELLMNGQRHHMVFQIARLRIFFPSYTGVIRPPKWIHTNPIHGFVALFSQIELKSVIIFLFPFGLCYRTCFGHT